MVGLPNSPLMMKRKADERFEQKNVIGKYEQMSACKVTTKNKRHVMLY